MNLLNKARRKVEAAIDELEDTARRLSISQPQYPPPVGYSTQQTGYHVAGYQPPPPPPPAPAPVQYWQQSPQYYTPPPVVPVQALDPRTPSPGQYATPQWQPPQPQQYFAPQGGLPQQQYYSPPLVPSPLQQVTSPTHSQQYFSPRPNPSLPQHTPSPAQSPLQHAPSPGNSQQYFSPRLNPSLPQHTPSPAQSPLQHTPSPANSQQYFSPQLNPSLPQHTPSPVQSQQFQAPPPPYSPGPNPPQQPYRQPSVISRPPSELGGSQRIAPPPLPAELPVELPAFEPPNGVQELQGSEVSSLQRPPQSRPVATARPQPPQFNASSVAPPLVRGLKLKCLATEGVRTTNISVKFHVPKTGEDFSVCDNCFRTYIAPYQGVASNFSPYKGPENVFICDLSFQRVQQILLKQCMPYSTIDPIRDFVKTFATLTACDGSIISSAGPMWITRNAVVPDMAICTTCFELYIRLTPFEGYFESVVYPETRDWSCDIVLPYFKRLLRSELDKTPPNFAQFAEEANSRLKLPACSGYGKPIAIIPDLNQHVFMKCKDKTGRCCLACYSDILELTPLADEWEPARAVGEDVAMVTCDLAGAYSKSAMSVAIKRVDTELWRTCVGLDGKLSPCYGKKGMDEANIVKEIKEKGEIAQWYQCIKSPVVLACPRCYWLFIKLFGGSHLFSPMEGALSPGNIRQCSWIHSNTPEEASIDTADAFEDSTTWRGRRLRTALDYGYQTGDWSQLSTVAASIANQPRPCAGNSRGFTKDSGRKWYGRIRANATDDNDATLIMCEECFVRIVKDRPHQALFNADLTEAAYRDNPKGVICQPYSNRARGYVQAAADSGDLATFARYWNNREALAARRNQWEPILMQQNIKMAMYNQQTSMAMMMKGNAMQNALSRIGSAGVVEAVSGDTGERWGNSQIGTDFHTKGRAEAEQAWVDAKNMKVGAGQGGDTAQETMRLLALWEVDNQAFLAVE